MARGSALRSMDLQAHGTGVAVMSDAAPPPASRCGRCELPLHAYREAHDCRMCDPLCPVWGTHGHLWDGDEETSRAAYIREVKRGQGLSAAIDRG